MVIIYWMAVYTKRRLRDLKSSTYLSMSYEYFFRTTTNPYYTPSAIHPVRFREQEVILTLSTFEFCWIYVHFLTTEKVISRCQQNGGANEPSVCRLVRFQSGFVWRGYRCPF